MTKTKVDEEDLQLFLEAAARTKYFKNKKPEAESIYRDVSDVLLQTQTEGGCGIEYAKVGSLLIKWLTSKKFMLATDYFANSLRTSFSATSTTVSSQDFQWLMQRIKAEIPSASKVHSLIEANESSIHENLISRVPPNSPEPLKEGMKISKSLKYYGLASESLRTVQDLISELIQNNKNSNEDEFHISIHPMDFLTVSVNAHNWASCHSHYGGYRSGPLSYMCDKFSLVSYLCDNKDFLINRTSTFWNSKKWRMMIHFDTLYTHVFASRQYPIDKNITPISESLKTLIKDLNPERKEEQFIKKLETSDWVDIAIAEAKTSEGLKPLKIPHVVMNGCVTPTSGVFRSHIDSMAYLDLGSLRHRRILAFPSCMELNTNSTYTYPRSLGVVIGDSTPCPYCGDHDIEDADSMGCKQCIASYDFIDNVCSACGDSIYENDGEWHENEVFCSSCYSESYAACCCCFDSMPLAEVYFTSGGESYCQVCYDKILEKGGAGLDCSECGKTLEMAGHVHEDDLYCSECFFELFEVCEECGDIDNRCEMIEKNDMYLCSYCYKESEEEYGG